MSEVNNNSSLYNLNVTISGGSLSTTVSFSGGTIPVNVVLGEDTTSLKKLERERLYEIYKTLVINGYYNKEQSPSDLAANSIKVAKQIYNYAYNQGWTPKNGKYRT